MSRRAGLGKGLAALGLGKQNKPQPVVKPEPTQELKLKEIKVNPHQPRSVFNPEALQALSESVKQYGVLQPVLVRKTASGYELIAGERRFRAAEMAGLTTIPVILREYNDAQMTEVALIENIQRENLNPIEEAKAYYHLLSDFGLTQEMLANKIGRSRPHIANFLRLLKLTPKVQQLVVEEKLTMGQAKPLLVIENEALQEEAAEFIVAQELSVRKVEQLVKILEKNPDYFQATEEAVQVTDVSPEEIFIYNVEDKLKMLLGTSVHIKKKGNKQRVEIDFDTTEDLARLLELLEKKETPVSQDKEATLDKLRQYSQTGKFSV